ncbi:MAG: type I pullulanase [Spirochaetales bacterium]|nr:type I pullulanase [Spirochaetales bacterium]
MKKLISKTPLFLILIAGVLLMTFSSCTAKDKQQNPAPAQEAPKQQTSPIAAEETIPDGFNNLTFYWKGNADPASTDIWIWWDGKDGSGYAVTPCDYGLKCSVNVPENIKEVGFIVRTDCSDPCQNYWGNATKDWPDDRSAVITDRKTEIYLVTGDGGQYRSSDSGKTLEPIRFFNLAGITDMNRVRFFIAPGNPEIAGNPASFKVTENGREIPVTAVTDLWANGTSGILTLAENLDITKEYSVETEGYGKRNAVPTEIFDSQYFTDNYTYDGDDLGAVVGGDSTTFKVWAPTASDVVLKLYEAGDGGTAFASVPMQRQDKGVWSAQYKCGHGTYYTYEVTTAAGTQEAVDPYARTAGVNGNRGMVTDLSLTNPAGFEKDGFVGLKNYSDAVIWEVHVRDFSNRIASSAYPGKYMAFTETGLVNSSGIPVGVDYLKNLGITHVHLQPVYDYATVDESRLDEPQFNWGYDPKNYNVPEGSYSTDPYHGEVRVNEFKQMVMGLHNAGLGVVMDVVYNHTYDINSNLNRIVPYYYYRYSTSGTPSNGSGCGNETASERAMFRKYMVDSLVYWLTEYHLDGFRFDLMAIHDITTMDQIEKAVHAINPSAIIYGEGWAGGTVAISSSEQATQGNISKITAAPGAAGSIAVFNDSIRDGLKGSVFSLITRGYINGSASSETANKVAFGIRGGAATTGTSWNVKKGMVVNYMSAHDNFTLWDKLEASNKDASRDQLLAMNRLGAEILMISRGTPFFLAGEEMLRTKDGDGNSYRSSDEINNIDWEALTPQSDEYAMALFYSKLIAMRKQLDFLADSEVTCRILENSVLEATYRYRGNVKAIAVINPQDYEARYTLPSGTWNMLLDGTEFPQGRTAEGEIAVSGKSIAFCTK